MASATGSQAHGGRRKSLDAEINLVPFIDLLSMCICFLLITAVWMQIGSMQIKQSHGTEAATPASNQVEMDLTFKNTKTVQVSVKRSGRTLKQLNIEAKLGESLAEKVRGDVRALLTSIQGGADISGLVSAAMVTPAKDVNYGDLVSVMDVLRSFKIVNLGVVPVRKI